MLCPECWATCDENPDGLIHDIAEPGQYDYGDVATADAGAGAGGSSSENSTAAAAAEDIAPDVPKLDDRSEKEMIADEKQFLADKKKNQGLTRSEKLSGLLRIAFVADLASLWKDGHFSGTKEHDKGKIIDVKSWLRYTKDGATCELCTKHASTSTQKKRTAAYWTKGNPCLQATRYAKSTVRKHYYSNTHQDHLKDSKVASVVDTEPVLQARADAGENVIFRAMTVAWLAVEQIATSKFPSLLGHISDCGGLHPTDANAGSLDSGNASWSSRYTATELKECVANVIMFDSMKKWQSSNFFAWLGDEMTTRASESMLMQAVRGVDLEKGSDTYGEPFTDFINVQHLPRGNAATVAMAAVYSMKVVGLSMLSMILSLVRT